MDVRSVHTFQTFKTERNSTNTEMIYSRKCLKMFVFLSAGVSTSKPSGHTSRFQPIIDQVLLYNKKEKEDCRDFLERSEKKEI